MSSRRPRLGFDLGAGVGLLVTLIGLGCVAVGRAAIAAHQAQIAADMGALAGAAWQSSATGVACGRAAEVVHANGARMYACAVDGLDVIVTARVAVSAGPVRGAVAASARAGPEQAVGECTARRELPRAEGLRVYDGFGQARQHHVEHFDRVGLGERLVAVAALGRLHARRAAALAPAGAIASRVARSHSPRRGTPARRNRRRPDARRRRRRSGASVSGCSAVDRPPMSQRSQVAISGSSPIEACSAACSAPGMSDGVDSGRRQRARRNVHHTAVVRSCRAGRSSGRVSITSPVARRRRWYDTTWLVTSTVPRNSPIGPASTTLVTDSTVNDVTSRACVVQSGSSACTSATPSSRSRASTTYDTPWCRWTAPECTWPCADDQSTVPRSRPVAASTIEIGMPPVPRRSTSGRPSLRPVPAGRPAPEHARRRPACPASRPRSHRRTAAMSAGVSGSSDGGRSTGAGRARTGWPGRARSPPPAARTARPGGARGRCRAGRPAPPSRTARPARLVRRGRPAATATPACPGSRRARTASSPTRSTPSSSALVEARPSRSTVEQRLLQRSPFLAQVAGAVGGDPTGQMRHRLAERALRHASRPPRRRAGTGRRRAFARRVRSSRRADPPSASARTGGRDRLFLGAEDAPAAPRGRTSRRRAASRPR